MKHKTLSTADVGSTKSDEQGEIKSPSKRMNKKIKRMLFIFFGIAVLAGIYLFRVSIVKKIYGIQQPKLENAQSILNTAKKYHLNTSCLVTVALSDFLNMKKDFNNGIPEALIFDRQSNYIEYKPTDSSCNGNLSDFIHAMHKNGRYKMSGKTTLNKEMVKLRDIQGNQLVSTYLDPTADFYILVAWTVFAGRLNRDHVKVWETLALSNKKAKVQIIEVNLDVQKWWPEGPLKDSILKTYGITNTF